MILFCKKYFYIIAAVLGVILLQSCAATNPFHETAKAGDTVIIAIGFNPDVKHDDFLITITPEFGTPILINASDPAIRGVMNLYPDPLSSLIVSRETSQDLTPFAQFYADLMSSSSFTNSDKDWFQSTIILDLPSGLPVGNAQLDVSTTALGTVATQSLIIEAGVGSPSVLGPTDTMLDALARVSHYTIDIQSVIVPYALELTIAHDADVTIGGTGKAHIVNPTGYDKNLVWSDDGTTSKIVITPANVSGAFDDVKDFKFYLAGGITNPSIVSVKGFDINGNFITNVTATIASNN